MCSSGGITTLPGNGRNESIRAVVMPDEQANRNLVRLGSAALGVVNTSQRVRRDNAGAKGRIPSQRETLRAVAAACTWPKVFGTPEGVVPAWPGPRPAKGEEEYDPKATMILTPELRKTFVALWVQGDGNCFWRSVARALWGTDEYWRQLKLAVLAWSAVNVEALVGKGGALFENGIHYENDIHQKYVYRGPDGKIDHTRDDYASMLLENIARFCENRRWGGDLAGVLFAERTGLVLKMPHPYDMRARIRADASGAAPVATASCGGVRDEFGDNRLSLLKVPTGGRKDILLRGVSGEPDIVVEEIAITMVRGGSAVVGDGSLSDIPVIEADTNLDHLNHFAAIVCTDPDGHVRRPFPMSKAGPPLHTKFDKLDAEQGAKEEAEWAERQARRAAQRAEVAAAAAARDSREKEARAAAAKRKRDGEGESGKQLGREGGEKEKEQGKGDGDGVDAETMKLEEAAAKQLPVYEESVLAAELDAKKKSRRYHELKEASSQAQQRSDASKEDTQLLWFSLMAEEELDKGRVSAAKARRAYEKALRSRNRALRALHKINRRAGVSSVLPSGVGEDDTMESDSCSEDSDGTMARGWNSDDDFFSAADARKTRAAAKEEEHKRLRAMIERKVVACSELAAATTGARAVAKRAKNAYKRLVDITADADDVALDGDTKEEEGKARASNEEVRGGRLAAARAWWKYKQAGHLQATAERELQKMRRDVGVDTMSEDDSTQYDSTFEYDSEDSDITSGWNSQDDSFSSGEDDGSDEKEDGPVDSSNLPDLEYKSKSNATRPVFAVLENPEDTWEKVFEDIKKALVIRGHNCATRVRGKERLSREAGARFKKKDLVCKNFGKPTSTPKHANVEKRRNTSSAKCSCGFKAKVSWPADGQPKLGKVCLTHVDACTAEPTARAQNNMVSGEVLEARFKGDIRQWTLAGLKQSDMYRLISVLVKPRQLGEPGRQKIRNMVKQVQRETWSTPTDARDLVSELKDMAGCYVKWDTDELHRLKRVFWSTGQQQVFARQWGGIVVQGNTALTNRYGMHFMLFLGVDSENKTVVFAQGFFSDQSSDTCQWALKHYCTICGGHPEVIITDADAGMTHAVETFLPSTVVHLYCLWHVMNNVRKNCARALGKKASGLYRLVYAAAFAATEEGCSDAWSEIFRHVRGSECEEYVTGYLLRHHRHWSRCFFPTTMTLNMTTTQRVEGIFGVLKKGRIVNHRCSLVWVKAELEKRIAGQTLASNLLSSKAPSLGRKHIDDNVLKTAEHVFRQLTDVGASTYAIDEMVAEMRASAAYDTAVLTEKHADDAACHDYLDDLAGRGEEAEGYCADVPAEAFEGSHDPDITMYGTTSLPSFAELVRKVRIDAVVQVQYKYPGTARRGQVSHIVVVGPEGFQLCTCLKLMRCGLHCSHVFAALVTRLDRASDFIGASIHPRWRKSAVEWSLRNVELGTFDGHETFTGFTEDFDGADFDGDGQDTLNTSVAHTRKKAYVDSIAMAQQWANQAAATVDGTPASYQAYCAMVERQRHEEQALVRGPGPSDRSAGLVNPPLTLPNDRKETRHKDAAGTEGGRPKKKSKVQSIVAQIQCGTL